MSQDLEEDDRLRLSERLVEDLVRVQFPQWAHLAVKRIENDGWDNSTFRLGEYLKVRLPTAVRYAAQVEKERVWLPYLAERLPVEIPEPLAVGEATAEYPYPWSIQRWIEGEPVSESTVGDLHVFAEDMAKLLLALRAVPAEGGPSAGVQSFFRGGALRTYDGDTRRALDVLGSERDRAAALAIWEEALSSEWNAAPVWVHGDVTPDNLLVRDGKLCAAIDFGTCAVGDPACDLTIAWTLFKGQSRSIFRQAVGLDEDCWARARGWALWKALITLAARQQENRPGADPAQQVVAELMDADEPV